MTEWIKAIIGNCTFNNEKKIKDTDFENYEKINVYYQYVTEPKSDLKCMLL